MIAQLIVIFLKGDTVRGDAVPKVMPFSCSIFQVKAEKLLFTGTVKVVQKPQPVIDRDLADARRHAGQAGGEIGTDSREECPCLFNIFLLYRDRDVLLLDQVVALCRLIQQQIIVLTAVLVLSVALHGHKQRPPKVLLVELPVE